MSATDNQKNKTVVIAGAQGCGKTSVICGLIHLGNARGLNIAGFKPFEIGLIKHNATEIPIDAELICDAMSGEPKESLISPYVGNEHYPIEMAFRRDGIRINWKIIDDRIALLSKSYDHTLIECPGSLFTPITKSESVFDWLGSLAKPVIWIINPIQKQFERNLAEIEKLATLNVPIHFVFNNPARIKDQELVFYVWEKIESVFQREAKGMIPHVKNLNKDFDKLAEKIDTSVPEMFSTVF